MITRAVHIEIALSQSHEHFIQAFRRFMARRGIPAVIFSDNAQTYRQSNITFEAWRLILKNCIDSVTNSVIKWTYIPPRMPWAGGFYERLIGSIKRNLRSTTAEKTFTAWELYTYLTEAESIVNSRPLSAQDLSTPITPSHLLYGRNIMISPPSFEKADLPENFQTDAHAAIIQQWRARTSLITHFFRRWKKDYFENLRQSSKWPTDHGNVKIGQIVIVLDDTLRKGGRRFPLGRVTAIKIGRDQRVRSVTLQLADGKSYTRSIRLLAPLEVEPIQTTSSVD